MFVPGETETIGGQHEGFIQLQAVANLLLCVSKVWGGQFVVAVAVVAVVAMAMGGSGMTVGCRMGCTATLAAGGGNRYSVVRHEGTRRRR